MKKSWKGLRKDRGFLKPFQLLFIPAVVSYPFHLSLACSTSSVEQVQRHIEDATFKCPNRLCMIWLNYLFFATYLMSSPCNRITPPLCTIPHHTPFTVPQLFSFLQTPRRLVPDLACGNPASGPVGQVPLCTNCPPTRSETSRAHSTKRLPVDAHLLLFLANRAQSPHHSLLTCIHVSFL